MTDAEVLQEILHRYTAIDRRDAIQPALAAILAVVDDVLAITRQDIEAARDIVFQIRGLSARDAIHAAIMQRHGISTIMTFDSGFAALPALGCSPDSYSDQERVLTPFCLPPTDSVEEI